MPYIGMAHLSSTDIIQTKPIGDGLNAFCEPVKLVCQDLGVSYFTGALSQLDGEGNMHVPVS
jgi:hypothetical protein